MSTRRTTGDALLELLPAIYRLRDAEVARGLDAGADLYITKPFSTRDLLSKIKQLLGT